MLRDLNVNLERGNGIHEPNDVLTKIISRGLVKRRRKKQYCLIIVLNEENNYFTYL